MSSVRIILLAAAVLPTAGVRAADLAEILGPISPVYEGDATGTTFTQPGWFPDAQFPLVWGGANEPDTNLSWWMARHSGGFLLDYNKVDGVWPDSQDNSPDERGYWITTVYRPVDVDPALRGTTVTLTIYPNDAVYGTVPGTEDHVIDDDYLVGYAHIEDWNETTGKEVNGARTVYSYDNGKNWKKGPLWALGVCAIDRRTIPGTTRLIHLGQDYMKPGWKKWTTDIAKGVEGYQQDPSAFSHGNLYGVTGILWNRYLNKWLVMFSYNGSVGTDIQFVTTDTFNTYSWEPTLSIARNEVPGRGVVAGAGDYPTLLGGFPYQDSYPVPFNMEMGQLGWVYNKNNGLSGRAIHFIKEVEKRIAWQGGGADTSGTVRIVPQLSSSPTSITWNGLPVPDLGDEDGDGVLNLIEYATGSPVGAASAMPGKASSDLGVLHFNYTRDLSAAALPVVEWSDTLLPGDWRSDGVTDETISSTGNLKNLRAHVPASPTGRRFMRLRVTRSASSTAVVSGDSAGPFAFGGGISLTVQNTEISSTGGGSALWTFTRTGSTAADLTVPFDVTGAAAFPSDYTIAGAATFTGTSGSVLIPAGQTSAQITTSVVSGNGKTIVISAPGKLKLATIANWNLTGGGFTGIVDETHTLDLNSTVGGTFQNDIPVTKRVRSINFGAASGNHTINGNRIELEAVNKWLTTGYAMYGINQYSANTATFNTDINTRTAALYLRPWVAGGKIVLNGKVDMLGSGGVVVSGPGDVAINGDLVNSGYSDFLTGQPEFVAGVNMSRLIMAGDGVLSLAGNNTFNGRSEIKYGSVRIESANALQNSVVTVKNSDALVPTTDFKLGGLDGAGNINLSGYHLTLGNHNRLDCYTTSYTGVIRGDGSITKVDNNTQQLGAINQHTGGTILKAGILDVPTSTRTAFGTGPIRFDGGTLRAAGPIVVDNAVQISAAGGTLDSNGRTIVFNGALSGTGPLLTTGTGALVLNASSTYSGALSSWSEIRANVANAFGTGILNVGGRLTIGADQTLGGLKILAAAPVIDTGAFTLSINGPIQVAAGRSLVKTGSGTLAWNGDGAAFFGDLVVNGGIFQASVAGDFAPGNVTLNGGGLSLKSSISGDVSINVAAVTGRKLTINGAASLVLDQGAANNLTVTIGSDDNLNALMLGDSSTVLATLGANTKLKVMGQTETPSNSIFSPAFLLAAPDRSGDFAAYSTADGFKPFTGYTPHSGSWTATTGEIANIIGDTTLAAYGTVNGLRVDGSKTLTLTSQVLTFAGTDSKAGLILNNGLVTGGAIDFGTNKGFIHTSGPNANIASAIRGSEGIVFTGAPGTKVRLDCLETTYSKRLTVAGTTLELPNTTVMGASGTPITLDGGGTLRFPNTLAIANELVIGTGGAGIDVAAGKTVTNDGTFSGSGVFRKAGAGYLKFNASGTSTGPVFVDGGTLEYISAAAQGSTGPITVAAGARMNISYSSNAFSHDFRIAGNGPGGEGALAIGGYGTTTSSITLTDDAEIQAINGATFGIYGPIYGQGHSLEISGTGRFGLHSAIDVEGADLSLSNKPYLSIKTTASVACENLTTAPNSTFELNTQNARLNNATIGGVLYGQKGRILARGTVTIASGGTIAGGFLNTPDLFTIDGNLTLADGSICHSYLKGGTGAASDGTGSKHGQILVTGSGVVDGTLTLQRDAAYTPVAGDEIFVMLRNGGSGNFDSVKVIDGSSTQTFSGTPGASIIVGGKTGILQYNRHSSINLSIPGIAMDISIKF